MKRTLKITIACPKCGALAWESPTAGGMTLYKCQGCGHAWSEGCNHGHKRDYLTEMGNEKTQCMICGKRWQKPKPKDENAHVSTAHVENSHTLSMDQY